MFTTCDCFLKRVVALDYYLRYCISVHTRVLHLAVLLFLKKILDPVSLREFFVFVIFHPYPPVELCYGFGMLLLCRDGFWEEKVGDCVKASIHLLLLVEVLLIYLFID